MSWQRCLSLHSPRCAAGRLLSTTSDLLADYVQASTTRGRCSVGGRIAEVQASDLSYEAFVRDYMAPNVPVLVLVRALVLCQSSGAYLMGHAGHRRCDLAG